MLEISVTQDSFCINSARSVIYFLTIYRAQYSMSFYSASVSIVILQSLINIKREQEMSDNSFQICIGPLLHSNVHRYVCMYACKFVYIDVCVYMYVFTFYT